MNKFIDTDDMIMRINHSFERLYRRENDTYVPHVCLICDKLIKPDEIKLIKTEVLQKNGHVLKCNSWNDISDELKQCYTYEGKNKQHWMKEMILSPRGTYVKETDG